MKIWNYTINLLNQWCEKCLENIVVNYWFKYVSVMMVHFFHHISSKYFVYLQLVTISHISWLKTKIWWICERELAISLVINPSACPAEQRQAECLSALQFNNHSVPIFHLARRSMMKRRLDGGAISTTGAFEFV